MKKLISATTLRQMAETGKRVVIPPQCVLTPSAQDLAKELGIQIVRENTKELQGETSQLDAISNSDAKPADTAGTLETQVRKVLSELLKPACTNPKVTHVKGATVVLQPFDQAPPGQNIKLVDVITAREANLAAGFMAFDCSVLPWNLTYDEVDYVIEGTFTIETGGKVHTCVAGDVFYIPKNTKVIFGSPNQAKVFYVTYPANWSEV
ncbi:cupin domain-containing protein [Sporomusa malonica]|uniref:Ethanolamine utilization protein EutQ n=1 Tax=Sporomusa malonica TaxID=112901 RepID=A0A1W2ERZ9_9FIRM|nr:cupin domain-containing protein [Sporomusa malonica]SMD12342.1 ethanolamine utilization protein EutQ [Sporomusa malonica]